MIPFHKAYQLKQAVPYLTEVLTSGRTEGDGPMSERCELWLSKAYSQSRLLMMTSGTHALEAALHALRLSPNDEVIVPSYSYPSAANAVILAGGTVVYAEVEPAHLTIDVSRLPLHVTKRTRAIICVHYGGNSCDMIAVQAIAKPRGIAVIEDCAQSFMTRYQNQLTGTMGTFGCFSFHGTKDIVAGEGGFLLINDPVYETAVRQFRQKGTNRDDYLKAIVQNYYWVSPGSSYVPAELTMALLLSQLEMSTEIVLQKRAHFARYQTFFDQLSQKLNLMLWLDGYSTEAPDTACNGHLFYLLFKARPDAQAFIAFMASQDIETRTHFVPLHESSFGQSFIRPENEFTVEAQLGQRLVRLPLFTDLTGQMIDQILAAAESFFYSRKYD